MKGEYINEKTKNLKYLDISYNEIQSISEEFNLPNLTGLGCSNCNLSYISALANLTSLTNLYLCNNNIIDISPIANLSYLEDLDLNNNKVTDITPISNLKALKYLTACYNEITKLADFSNFKNLRNIWLNHNKVSDLTTLRALIESNNPKKPSIALNYQEVSIPKDMTSNSHSLPITVKDYAGNPLTNIFNITNGGEYNKKSNTITWDVTEDTGL